jgi:transcription elongation factor Elf1
MSKLIISGKKSYTTRTYKHLFKKYPRVRMILRDKKSTMTKGDKCPRCNSSNLWVSWDNKGNELYSCHDCNWKSKGD